MYFLVDTKSQTIKAFAKMGNAARFILNLMGIEPNQPDPVKQLSDNNYFSDRFLVVNLAGAFESIAESDNKAAQELAEQYKRAVNEYYEQKTL